MRRILLSLAVVLFAATLAQAQVNVGDKPAIDFAIHGGEGRVTSDSLKNKVVIVDFWATWCPPCMAEAGHMVDLNTKYADKGLQFVGISLDRDPAALARVVKEKNFTWPQAYGQPAAQMAGQWGVRGIPSTFILSPDGVVLWKGHPAMIDKPLEEAFKSNPPRLVDPAVLSAANKSLDGVEAALKDGKTIDALKLMGSVSADAKKDKTFAARADKLAGDLQQASDALLAEVDLMVEAKQYSQAAGRLSEIMRALPGSPVGQKARAKQDALMARPEVKAAIETEKRNTAAAGELEAAQKLKAAKRDSEAYAKFKSIAKTYAGTENANTSAAIVAEYEKDAASMKQMTDSADATKARSMLSMAASYAQSGKADQARKKYQDVIDQFPNSPHAETAKAELAKLR